MDTFTSSKTNWKYILIVVVLAFFVGGGIFGYYWLTSVYKVKPFEEQKVEIPKPQQKIILTSDKNEYERQEIAEFTLLNNSSSNIFLRSRNQYVVIAEVMSNTELQKYNFKEERWIKTHNYFVYPGEDVGPRISFLGAGKEIKLGELHINNIIEPLDLNEGKYRLIFWYYENELCGGFSYWANEELCEKERKEVSSNEFIIKGGSITLPKMGDEKTFNPAMIFCREKNERYYCDQAFFFNFDEDEEKEIIGICWRGFEYDKEGILFVLDKQNNKYKSVLEKEGRIHQRYYTFKNLKVEDVDKDGIDEIIYGEIGWYLAGGNSYLHLYSPKYQEWFYRDNWWDVTTTGIRKEGIGFSPNLELEKYKAFKEFLLGE